MRVPHAHSSLVRHAHPTRSSAGIISSTADHSCVLPVLQVAGHVILPGLAAINGAITAHNAEQAMCASDIRDHTTHEAEPHTPHTRDAMKRRREQTRHQRTQKLTIAAFLFLNPQSMGRNTSAVKSIRGGVGCIAPGGSSRLALVGTLLSGSTGAQGASNME